VRAAARVRLPCDDQLCREPFEQLLHKALPSASRAFCLLIRNRVDCLPGTGRNDIAGIRGRVRSHQAADYVTDDGHYAPPNLAANLKRCCVVGPERAQMQDAPGNEVQCDNAWADIDVELKRRCDLIPNLVAAVKGYAAHEKATLKPSSTMQPWGKPGLSEKGYELLRREQPGLVY